MVFQDAYTLDTERLRRCSLHVYKNGKTMPFCVRYLTAERAEVGLEINNEQHG
jgi:7,8-dihydro-6-hydroxymethylpterin dimethyltransferase